MIFNALYFFYENKNLTLPMTRPSGTWYTSEEIAPLARL